MWMGYRVDPIHLESSAVTSKDAGREKSNQHRRAKISCASAEKSSLLLRFDRIARGWLSAEVSFFVVGAGFFFQIFFQQSYLVNPDDVRPP